MKPFIRLLRVKHYIKNLLVFLPLFFGRALSDRDKIISAVLGFIAFSFLSSAVYIFNDMKDVESDRLHPTKRTRPLACGEITFAMARILFLVCLAIALLLSVVIDSLWGGVCLAVYLLINLTYSLGWKNVPVLDVVLLASGFVLRVFYGGIITHIEISDWLYLVVIAIYQ